MVRLALPRPQSGRGSVFVAGSARCWEWGTRTHGAGASGTSVPSRGGGAEASCGFTRSRSSPPGSAGVGGGQVVQHLCYTFVVGAKNPRIHTVLDPRLFAVVKSLAEEHGSSLSQEAHDLIREAVELHEDRALDALAERRRTSWDPQTALTVADVRARIEDG